MNAFAHWRYPSTFYIRFLRRRSKRYRRRAATENPWELRRHPEAIRLPLLVFYCMPREAEIIDGLIELLIQITHRITVRARRWQRVMLYCPEILSDFQHVRGKAGILFRVAAAALKDPDRSRSRRHLSPSPTSKRLRTCSKNRKRGKPTSNAFTRWSAHPTPPTIFGACCQKAA